MIKIDRSIVTPPKILTSPDGKGKKEQREVIAFYNVSNNIDKPFKKYKVYANKEVKKALIKLCKAKCAYCESKFLHVYVGDVEHFRPKGKVRNRLIKMPGYYWLASSWNNLLLSCRNCNQSSRQYIKGFDEELSVGKHDKFPLSENADISEALIFSTFNLDDDEKHRLLIDPTKENPEDFFEYDKNGVIKINKELKETQKEYKMAETSIQVYALQRVPLVQAREKKIIEIYAQIQRVKKAVELVSKVSDSTSPVKKLLADEILKRELDSLKKFLNEGEEFLGLARYIINGFLKFNFQIT